MGKIQFEYELALQRHQRLSLPDDFANEKIDRPLPTSNDGKTQGKPLYVAGPKVDQCSLIRQDDIEVYFRIQQYQRKLFRDLQKYVGVLKWLPYSRRYDIWKDSRIMMIKYKEDFYKEQYTVFQEVQEQIKFKLLKAGFKDEKLINGVIDKYTSHLKDEEYESKSEQLLNTNVYDHHKPPLLIKNNIELKHHVLRISNEFNITGDIDMDNGHSFTYQIQVMFPGKVQAQTLKLQFDWYDQQYSEIASFFVDSKSTQLKTMIQYQENERNKARIGQVNIDFLKNNQDTKDSIDDINKQSNTKIKKSQWLDIICFRPRVSSWFIRQQAVLKQRNHRDQLLKNAFDMLDITDTSALNKILEEAAQAHVQRALNRNPLRGEGVAGKKYTDFISEDQELLNTLKLAVKPNETDSSIKKIEEQLFEPIPSHIIKAYYQLKHIKARENKIKLLHALNYFRSIQRRIALEMRDMGSRDRVLGDIDIITPSSSSTDQSSTPASQMTQRISMQNKRVDFNIEPDNIHPVDFKGFKQKKQFKPQTSSTNPSYPKIHASIDPPSMSDYHSVSQEQDNLLNKETANDEAKKLQGRIDTITFSENKDDVDIQDDFGVSVIYDAALNDFIDIEDELVKIGTFYINKHEYVVDAEQKEPVMTVDRVSMGLDLIELETKFQYRKIFVVEQYLEALSHTYDILEQQRLVQIIVDTMALRPNLNLDAAYFVDSYHSDIETLDAHQKLIREILDHQIRLEVDENNHIKDFLELKYRRINDHVQKIWKYEEEAKFQDGNEQSQDNQDKSNTSNTQDWRNPKSGYSKDEVDSSVENNLTNQNVSEHKKRLEKISERHITEYAQNQYLDFAEVLGLPEITAEDLFQRQSEKEPFIVDTLREQARFVKIEEGYPQFFAQQKRNVSAKFHLDAPNIPILDFYDSLSLITKVHAAIFGSFDHLEQHLKPENGLAYSTLQRSVIYESNVLFKIIKGEVESYLKPKVPNNIDDGSIFDHPDKLIFLIKEMKAHTNPEKLLLADPRVIAHLDLHSIQNFKFPHERNEQPATSKTQPAEKTSITDEEMVHTQIQRSIKTVKTPTQQKFVPQLRSDGAAFDKFLKKQEKPQNFDSLQKPPITMPSMVFLFCNMIESTRLREQLISLIQETRILTDIYKSQLKLVNKDNIKLQFSDSINFDTTTISKDKPNYVDTGDGSNIPIDMPFLEFDQSLKAQLNFRSDSCVKILATDLGVEELRAIVHYQLMHYQLLVAGVLQNQFLIDGAQRAKYELECLNSKPAFVVPNPYINLNNILSKNVEGYNTEMFNKEKTRVNTALSREAGEYIFNIFAKKSKLRPTITKRYQVFMTKLQNSQHKMEAKLRILRSYRIKLLHSYCKEICKDVYLDTIKIQILKSCNQLRWYAGLMPKEAKFFICGGSEFQENLPRYYFDQLMKNSQVHSINSYLNKSFDSIYYIPSTDEIMKLTSAYDESLRGAKAGGFSDTIEEDNLESSIKDMVKCLPNNADDEYKVVDEISSHLRFSIRKVNFDKSYNYLSIPYKFLTYFTLIERIFSMEYFKGKFNSPGQDIMKLEQHVLCGRQFWDKVEADQNMLEERGANLSEKLINKIVKEKRTMANLKEDMIAISQKMKDFERYLDKKDFVDFESLINVIIHQYETSYYETLYGLDKLKDQYYVKGYVTEIQAVGEVLEGFTGRPQGVITLSSGYHVNHSCMSPNHFSLDISQFTDHNQFMKAYQPAIDENVLMPPQINLVHNLYGYKRDANYHPSQFVGQIHKNGQFDSLYWGLMNLSDNEKVYAFTNFNALEEYVDSYLKIENVANDSLRRYEILAQKREFFKSKVEAHQLKHAIMSWFSCQPLPLEPEKYAWMERQYKDEVFWKILHETDRINNQNLKDREDLIKKTQGSKIKKGLGSNDEALLQKAIMKSLVLDENEQATFSQMIQTKAQISVIKTEFELQLVKAAISFINKEHSALLGALEMGCADKEINVIIHPQQQFACTLFQNVDRNAHLDITNKVSFVQQFLTRLKNRCTEVETLTSGPGVVFSLKDFNECLQTLCRGLIKYSEQEMRTRSEQSSLRQSHVQHLVYVREQQMNFFKNRCERYMSDLDKMINAKMTEKGNQIIYELDVASRELRMLKDNYYLMERLLRDDIRYEYQNTIVRRNNEIQKYKSNFTSYKSELNNEIKAQISSEISLIGKTMKTKAEYYKGNGGTPITSGGAQQMKSPRGGDKQMGQMGVIDEEYCDPEARKEILQLHRLVRKQNILFKMKEVLQKEKHDREMFNLKQQLTSNACLWEQLAESEKREQIMRQELFFTQQSLATCEKIIEKMQNQMEVLHNQRVRLQQYKNSKSKRLEELESKVRQMEVIENLDLNKLLEEFQKRDKKMKELKKFIQGVNERDHESHKVNDQKMNQIRRQFEREQQLKNEAFEKLESLRLEIRALEGKDLHGDVWKDKCKELFEICKDMQSEIDDLKSAVIHMEEEKELIINQSQLDGGPNRMFQGKGSIGNSVMPPSSGLEKTTKPSTAAAYGMSAGGMGFGLGETRQSKGAFSRYSHDSYSMGHLKGVNARTASRGNMSGVDREYSTLATEQSGPMIHRKMAQMQKAQVRPSQSLAQRRMHTAQQSTRAGQGVFGYAQQRQKKMMQSSNSPRTMSSNQQMRMNNSGYPYQNQELTHDMILRPSQAAIMGNTGGRHPIISNVNININQANINLGQH